MVELKKACLHISYLYTEGGAPHFMIPTTAPVLMNFVYRKAFPEVNKELAYWRQKANDIPNKELRTQAIASMDDKKFHCQGGSVYAILSRKKWKEAVRFIVAYQTISDYLDNLCDRSTSLDPADFRLLHQSMADALNEDAPLKDYYALREDQNDGGYLHKLVKTCQEVLRNIEQVELIKPHLLQLENLYSDLQVHKHVAHEERIDRLENWFKNHKESFPELNWQEFSASSGSTLGVFCMVSYALGGKMTEELAGNIFKSYFPYMQGLHILLDYYIDQQEDLLEGDLNFCSYYKDETELQERLLYFIKQTNHNVQKLPNKIFHEMIHHGLVGLYLADPKVSKLKNGKMMAKRLIKASGRKSKFFHLNVLVYNRLAGR